LQQIAIITVSLIEIVSIQKRAMRFIHKLSKRRLRKEKGKRKEKEPAVLTNCASSKD